MSGAPVASGSRLRRRPVGGGQRCGLALIRFYQFFISPLFPPSCRFVPSCSEYAREAITSYGVWRGGWLAFKRILRCHPFCRGGFDPLK
ncbi:MAG: membrane protein insertion efficiency factor YidD [Desulfurivibrio sp.]|nr:membrane protein insertion efficiency factor YidD [Desulfurivibrio sp.]